MPVIRPARAGDLPLLPAVESAADTVFAGMPLPPPGDAATLVCALQVLVAGDPPVGFARIEEVDGRAHLEQLSVHPAHARRGVGAGLLRAVFAYALGARYRAVTLITFRDVAWNAPFYRRHGFRPVDELTPGLAALRRHEIDLGMDALGVRVVLRRELRRSAPGPT